MSKEKKIGIAIMGGTGYGAGELLRILAGHPDAQIVSISSNSAKGKQIVGSHPHLAGVYDLTFSEKISLKELTNYEYQVVFSALPHGTSGSEILKLKANREAGGVHIIDLSGDFRLADKTLNEIFYPESPKDPDIRRQFVYGLTEVNAAAIAKASYIANPGCLASACALSVAPLIGEDFRGAIAFNANTGTSGAGRSLHETFHHPEMHANSSAYKVLVHRHEPEIRQALGDPSGARLTTTFVPHLIPVSRGILATAHLTLDEETTTKDLIDRYGDYYKSAPFIRVREEPPNLRDVIGSNFCDVSVVARGRQVVAMAALDNLVKGMAGQAIQNMNMLCGLPQTNGLLQAPLGLI